MKVKHPLKGKDFMEMAAIEAKYYAEDFITDWEDSLDWYEFSQDTTVAIEDKGHIVGFMNLFPISDRFYEVLSTGADHDGFLDLEDVLRVRDGESASAQGGFHLFLSCVAVHPDYRKSEAIDLILKAYLDLWRGYEGAGHQFKQVVTHNVTSDGTGFSLRMGFEPVKQTADGTQICIASAENFFSAIERRISTSLGGNL